MIDFNTGEGGLSIDIDNDGTKDIVFKMRYVKNSLNSLKY